MIPIFSSKNAREMGDCLESELVAVSEFHSGRLKTHAGTMFYTAAGERVLITCERLGEDYLSLRGI